MKTKDDIVIRHYNGKQRPVICVKCYGGLWRGLPDNIGTERAREFAWEAAVEQFWNEAQDVAKNIFGKRERASAFGRSGGWLSVSGFTAEDVAEWTADDVAKWWEFAKEIRSIMDYLATDEWARETIESNRWNEDGAERYNFKDAPDGGIICLSELKAKAIAAGFGAVVRS